MKIFADLFLILPNQSIFNEKNIPIPCNGFSFHSLR